MLAELLFDLGDLCLTFLDLFAFGNAFETTVFTTGLNVSNVATSEAA